MKHLITVGVAAVWISTQAAASVVTHAAESAGGYLYWNTISSPGSDVFTSLLVPFLDAAAVPELGDVEAPFAWSTEILTDVTGNWGFDASAHSGTSGFFGGGTPFETPVALLAFRYDVAGYNAARDAAASAQQDLTQAQTDLAATRASLVDETRTFDTIVFAMNALEGPLRDAEREIQNIRLFAQATQRSLASQGTRVRQIEDDIARLGSTPLLEARLANAQAEFQRLQEELNRIGELSREAREARDALQTQFDDLSVSRAESIARQGVLVTQENEQLVELSLAELVVIAADAREGEFLATRVSAGATVSGFNYVSPFGPIDGPVRLGGSEAGPSFVSVQVAGGPAAVPLPAGAVLVLTGLAGLGLLRRRRRSS